MKDGDVETSRLERSYDSTDRFLKTKDSQSSFLCHYQTGNVKNAARKQLDELKSEAKRIEREIQHECFQSAVIKAYLNRVSVCFIRTLYTPYFPFLHKPGWLLRYILGPFTWSLAYSACLDILAGMTVALTLIPQALSYAQLASLPPIHGLYTAILPSVVYAVLGSSMQLSIGPVALVSLLLSQLISKYGIDPHADPSAAIDFAADAALATGLLFVIFGFLNLGGLISFISHPVMSGFTTAAATLIGLNQLRSAFGFVISVPQQGQAGYPYNYQVYAWFAAHLNDRTDSGFPVINPYAASIAFGVYIPLLSTMLFRNYLNKRYAGTTHWWVLLYNIFSSIMPLVALIIAARVAFVIKHDPTYSNTDKKAFYAENLSVIGKVTAGLNFIRIPHFRWNFALVLGDVFPLTLIAFMESYSVAHRIASQNNQLHLLKASQELWAVGSGNFLASISSGFPVAGSFSRSSLNATAGARTPLSKIIAVLIVILSLAVLTDAFVFIPNAALAAIVWVSIYGLISLSDFWNAWKHTKKDFLVMLITFAVVFVFDTALGLIAGLGLSLLLFLIDYIFSQQNGPMISSTNELESSGVILRIILRNDLNFLTSNRFEQILAKVVDGQRDKATGDRIDCTWNERAFHLVTKALDKLLIRNGSGYDLIDVRLRQRSRPKVIILDFQWVRLIDLGALIVIEEAARNVRDQESLFLIINATPTIAKMLRKYGIHNDRLEGVMDADAVHDYVKSVGGIIPFRSIDMPVELDVDEERGLVNADRTAMIDAGGNRFAELPDEMEGLEMKVLERMEHEELKMYVDV